MLKAGPTDRPNTNGCNCLKFRHTKGSPYQGWNSLHSNQSIGLSFLGKLRGREKCKPSLLLLLPPSLPSTPSPRRAWYLGYRYLYSLQRSLNCGLWKSGFRKVEACLSTVPCCFKTFRLKTLTYISKNYLQLMVAGVALVFRVTYIDFKALYINHLRCTNCLNIRFFSIVFFRNTVLTKWNSATLITSLDLQCCPV